MSSKSPVFLCVPIIDIESKLAIRSLKPQIYHDQQDLHPKREVETYTLYEPKSSKFVGRTLTKEQQERPNLLKIHISSQYLTGNRFVRLGGYLGRS